MDVTIRSVEETVKNKMVEKWGNFLNFFSPPLMMYFKLPLSLALSEQVHNYVCCPFRLLSL